MMYRVVSGIAAEADSDGTLVRAGGNVARVTGY